LQDGLGVREVFIVAKGLTPNGSYAVLVIDTDVNRMSNIWLKGGEGLMDGVNFAVVDCSVGA
jgi:hypothetical protein